MSVFGDIKTGDDVEDAVEATLRLWFRTYLNEIELQKGVPSLNLPAPRSYTNHNEFTTFPEDQLPQCVIISPGMAGPPKMEGDGTFRAFWRLGIGVVNSAKDAASTNRNSKWYAAAVRAIILQHRSLGGIAQGVKWELESYEEGPVESERTLAVASCEFIVEVEGVVDSGQGPAVPEPPDPDDLPGSDWPLVETTGLEVKKKED